MRKWLSLFLILIGVGAIALTAATSTRGAGPPFAVAVLVIFTWIGVGILQAHVVGLRRRLVRHIGGKWERIEIVSHVIPTADRPNFQLALDNLRSADPSPKPVYGVLVSERGLTSIKNANPEPVAIEWEQFPSGTDTNVPCATNAIYLLRTREGKPFCALVRPRAGATRRGGQRSRGQMELEIAAANRTVAESAMEMVRDAAERLSVYRGEVISLEKPDDGPAAGEPFAIKFHDLPSAPRERIILPDDVMRVVERNVLGLLEHRETLRRAGRGTRHGVLFHGPPGTGKTLITRYLAKACPQYTVILLNARNQRFVRESCRLARLMAPSMLVLEDVDLIAAERRKNRHAELLHALMDEMDGLGGKAECIFILTTNRPEILEPALAARPGRVDQAVYFPLPDLDCRRRLVALFSDGLDLSNVDVEEVLARTEGASPAFLEELFRKAALLAAERGERASPLPLRTEDFRGAIRELVEFGGDLTRNLLGFTPKGSNT
jgi:hypothetical protein